VVKNNILFILFLSGTYRMRIGNANMRWSEGRYHSI